MLVITRRGPEPRREFWLTSTFCVSSSIIDKNWGSEANRCKRIVMSLYLPIWIFGGEDRESVRGFQRAVPTVLWPPDARQFGGSGALSAGSDAGQRAHRDGMAAEVEAAYPRQF